MALLDDLLKKIHKTKKNNVVNNLALVFTCSVLSESKFVRYRVDVDGNTVE